MPVGTTGESPTLSHDEHRRVVEICVEEAKGRVPVIAGAGSNNTAEAVELARHAEKAGADAVLVVTPYYNKPTQEGLYQHFKAVNDAIGIPIIIYNIPPRSVIDMSVDTMKRLYELQEHRRRQGRDRQYRRASRLQRAGDGPGFHPALGRGHDGARLHGAWRPWLHLGDVERRAAAVRASSRRPASAGDYAKALTIQDRLMPLHTALFLETEPSRRQICAFGCSAACATRCACRWCR